MFHIPFTILEKEKKKALLKNARAGRREMERQ
jgi:hypothetical protein